MGYPLSQTLFTSLYIDRILMPAPLSLEHTLFDKSESSSDMEPLELQVLRAYCLGLIKTCWFVNTRVKAEHFYEVFYSLLLLPCYSNNRGIILGRRFCDSHLQQKSP
jgi:hypothetical protein